MDPLAVFLFLALLALAILAAAALLSQPGQRRCPSCDAPVAVTARACRSCGYAFV